MNYFMFDTSQLLILYTRKGQ